MSTAGDLLPVAILMGGLATRLGPLTLSLPKALVPVGGRPFVFRQLDFLRGQGVRRVVLCIGHFGGQIRAAVGDGSAFGLDVRYSDDGPQRLGTAGAVRRALPLLGPEFFVLYGDSYLPVDFAAIREAYKKSGLPALMTVFRNAGRWDASNVRCADGHVVLYDKRSPKPDMHYIDYGLSVLSSAALAGVALDEPADLGDVFHALSLCGHLAAFEVSTRFYEIGSPAGLHEAEQYFTHKG